MNTNEIGGIGEASFIAQLVKRGLNVSIPLSHDTSYDLVVEKSDGKLAKLQIKTTTSTEDILHVKIQRTYTSGERIVSRTYTEDDFDLLGVYDLRTEQCYIIPVAEVAGKTALSMRFTPTKNNQTKRVVMANGYLLGSTHI